MHNLLLSPKAEVDLEKIYEYTFTSWNERQADKYQDELFEGMNTIKLNVEIGEIYPYAKIPYRKFNVRRHIIFYRLENKNCIVVRVLHESMDLNEHLEIS